MVDEKDMGRFQKGRNGDHLMTPFQCDICHFRNIKNRDYIAGRVDDQKLMICIRRANLDAFWAREPTTVYNNMREMTRCVSLSEELGISDSSLVDMGPFPLKDVCGVGMAAVFLRRTLDKGQIRENVQFSTARKTRTAFGNCWNASVKGLGDAIMARETNKLFATSNPSYTMWFERFMTGAHKRMGDQTNPDLALPIEAFVEFQNILEDDWNAATSMEAAEEIEELACAVLGGLSAGLRGEEIPKLDTAGLLQHHEEGRDHLALPHVPLCLLGRFKGERGERYHMMPIAWKTDSGIENGKWFSRLVRSLQRKRREHGAVFIDKRGKRKQASSFEQRFFEILERIQEEKPGIISASVDVPEDCGISRTIRRSATTRARLAKVSEADTDANNRWRTVEAARGRAPAHKRIRDHYSEISLMLELLLRFSFLGPF